MNLRAPLGSNDMDKALSAAAASFGGEAKNPRAVVYIGDGSSRANPLSPERFQQLAGGLAESTFPCSATAWGRAWIARCSAYWPGRPAACWSKVLRARPGARLATAATAAVYWPTAAVKWPAGMGEVLPKTLPPLRNDRDTVLIGTLKGKYADADRSHGGWPRRPGDAGLECDSGSERRRQQLSAFAGIAGAGRRRREPAAG